jgi:DNA polymerase-3 subunit delta'
VPEADRLGVEAANMLLKCMEEPATPTVFVLVGHDGERIPATVKSRLVQLRLGPVAADVLDAWLAGQGVAEAERREAVRLAGGRPGFALRWARDPEERKRLAEAARVVDVALRATSAGAAMAAFDALFRQADAADDTAAAWRGVCDALAYALRDRFAELPARAAKLAQAVVAAERHVGGAVSPRVWFEATLLGEGARLSVV